MAYTNIISRTEADALMPEQAANEIIAAIPENSLVMELGRRLRDMTRQELTLQVEDALPEAYFVGATTAVSGDDAKIQTTESNWVNKTIKAAKLAVIVPISRDVFADADVDIFELQKAKIAEAMGKAFDAAVFHGTNAPSDWPDDLVTGATAASQVIDLSSAASASVPRDLYDCLMGVNGIIAMVEESGFFCDGHVAAMNMRAKLRQLREPSFGRPIFNADLQSESRYQLDGESLNFSRNGGLDKTAALLIAGDWQQLVWSMRKDLTFEVLTEATLYDSNGTTITHRLAQEDKIGLKCTMRLGWQLPNPPNRINASGYPFAVLVP